MDPRKRNAHFDALVMTIYGYARICARPDFFIAGKDASSQSSRSRAARYAPRPTLMTNPILSTAYDAARLARDLRLNVEPRKELRLRC